MSMSAVLIISLAAGVILVVGGGLLMYMSNLVKNAYEIKVQINADMEDRLKAIAEDLDKKSKWIKRDLIEDVDKMKNSVHTDTSRRLTEMLEPFNKRLEAIEAKLALERGDWSKAVDDTKVSTTAMDAKINQLRKDLKRVEEQIGLSAPTAASTATGGPQLMGDKPAATTGGPTAKPAAAAPPPKPEPPKGPQSVTTILKELG